MVMLFRRSLLLVEMPRRKGLRVAVVRPASLFFGGWGGGNGGVDVLVTGGARLHSTQNKPPQQHKPPKPPNVHRLKDRTQRIVDSMSNDVIIDIVEHWTVGKFYGVGAGGVVVAGASLAMCGLTFPTVGLSALVGGWWALGMFDLNQRHHAIRRNFPVLGHMRYLLESIGPELRQYFVEAPTEAEPFSRNQRAVVYRRAKGVDDTMPFGTRSDVYKEGYEWVSHSMFPTTVDDHFKRVVIGGRDCLQPYSASRLNISALSYGALSDNAILALNTAAREGGFYHNTGEGGVSRFHSEPGGDIVWNIGTGYFGCRDPVTKGFCPTQFVERATKPNIKMIEIKLSQGAKPAHGGMLPGAKVTEAIAHARGISIGETCLSPPTHSAFSDPRGLLLFVQQLRDLSGGKPVGFKLCMGRPPELSSIIAAMVEMDVYPDFITIDGSEGGTGAAPSEFSNHVGWPLHDAITFTHNTLVGAGVRDQVKIIASGKILSGFSMLRTTALGADVCNSARAFMFALGCIQSLKCNTNKCPTGIATQNPVLMRGLDVGTKWKRVMGFQQKTMESYFDLVGAVGVVNPADVLSRHIMRRMEGGTYSKSYAEIFPPLEPGSLLVGGCHNHPTNVQQVWDEAVASLHHNKRKKSFAYTTEPAY